MFTTAKSIATAALVLGAGLAPAALGAEPDSARTSSNAASAIPATLSREDARHLLSRTGFSPDIKTLEQFVGRSRERAVREIVAGAAGSALIEAPAWVQAPALTPAAYRKLSTEARRDKRRVERERAQELKQWWLSQMVQTDTPLAERMVLFWHNHFTSSFRKVRSSHLMYEQHLLLRKHALGSFAQMLHAISRDPAMLTYLDNVQNRKSAPNENFARELLELFTLGEGHYSEADIKEAARAFSGWGVSTSTLEFKIRRKRHDAGMKRFLQHRGRLDGEDVVEILLSQARTAEFVTEKMWREFVSLQPEPAQVTRLAKGFATSDYDIAALLQAVLSTEAFWSPGNRGALIKSPVELVVGTMRLAGTLKGREQRDATFAVRVMRDMGQDLFDPPNVAGWEGGLAWITSGSLLLREQFAERVARSAGRREGSSFERAALNPQMQASLESWLLASAPVSVTPRRDARQYALALLADPAYQLK